MLRPPPRVAQTICLDQLKGREDKEKLEDVDITATASNVLDDGTETPSTELQTFHTGGDSDSSHHVIGKEAFEMKT